MSVINSVTASQILAPIESLTHLSSRAHPFESLESDSLTSLCTAFITIARHRMVPTTGTRRAYPSTAKCKRLVGSQNAWSCVPKEIDLANISRAPHAATMSIGFFDAYRTRRSRSRPRRLELPFGDSKY